MPVILDTNVLIRFFTNDIPEKAIKVKKLIDSSHDLQIPDVVFPELEYILSIQYGIKRVEITRKFKFLINQNNISVSPQVKKAVYLFAKSNLDMADSIIAASAINKSLASFDKELLQVEGENPFWK